VEVFNDSDIPIILEANSTIAAGRILHKEEINNIRPAEQTI
jgi:hypothetical protein